MAREDMTWRTLCVIVDDVSEPERTVSLQGECEPTLQPRFWNAMRDVRTKKYVPYTIISGSRINTALIALLFLTIGVSVDSSDPAEARHIGRHYFDRVLANLEALRKGMQAQRIIVRTVDMGQPLHELRNGVRETGFERHIVRLLTQKNNYTPHYSIVACANLARARNQFAARPHHHAQNKQLFRTICH